MASKRKFTDEEEELATQKILKIEIDEKVVDVDLYDKHSKVIPVKVRKPTEIEKIFLLSSKLVFIFTLGIKENQSYSGCDPEEMEEDVIHKILVDG